MPSTYTDLLRFIDQANGENEYTWGDLADTNFNLIEDAIAGMHTENITGSSDHTLTTASGTADESRNMIIQLTGIPSANLSVFVPSKSKIYIVLADFTGSFTVTVETGSGSGVDFLAGERALIACDGSNVIKIANVASATDSSRIFQPGMSQMWNGTIAGIPTGWLFENGAAVSRTTYAALFAAIGTIHGAGNGTTTFNLPDSRDVIIIGATQDDVGVPKTNITGALTASGGSYAGATITGAGGDHAHGGSTGSYALLTADIPSHSHASGTLTAASGGSHTHSVITKNQATSDGSTVSISASGLEVRNGSTTQTYTTPTGEGAHTHTITGSTATAGSGGGHSHSITSSGTHTHTVTLPSYKTKVFMIKT